MHVSFLSPLFSFSLFFSLLLPLTPSSAENLEHPYKDCSLVATEIITITQLYHKGLTLKQTLESLPNLNTATTNRIKDLYQHIDKEGLQKTYSMINSRFATCAKEAYQKSGKPDFGSEEYGYYFCAGENKKRYEIILAIHMGGSLEEILPQVHPSHRQITQFYAEQHKSNGTDALFDILGDSLKNCINQIYH